jgi:hypothetical protein
MVPRSEHNRIYSWDAVTVPCPTLFPQARTNTMTNTRLQTTLRGNTCVQDSEHDSSAVFECHEDIVAVTCSYRVSHNSQHDYRHMADKCKMGTSRFTAIQVFWGYDAVSLGECTRRFEGLSCLYLQESSSSRRTAVIFLFRTMTNAQLSHKLSHSYMFRHYRAILRRLVISTLPRYASISNAAVGNTIYN